MRWDQPIPKSDRIGVAIAHSMLFGAWFGTCCASVWGLGLHLPYPTPPMTEIIVNVLLSALVGASVGGSVGLVVSPALVIAFVCGISQRQLQWMVILTTSASVASSIVPIPVGPIYRCILLPASVYVLLCVGAGFVAWRFKRDAMNM